MKGQGAGREKGKRGKGKTDSPKSGRGPKEIGLAFPFSHFPVFPAPDAPHPDAGLAGASGWCEVVNDPGQLEMPPPPARMREPPAATPLHYPKCEEPPAFALLDKPAAAPGAADRECPAGTFLGNSPTCCPFRRFCGAALERHGALSSAITFRRRASQSSVK